MVAFGGPKRSSDFIINLMKGNLSVVFVCLFFPQKDNH